MREYDVEIGVQNTAGAFLRQVDEPILARTNDQAVLVASEIIKWRIASQPRSIALFFDGQTRLVRAWRPGPPKNCWL
jgi:hypothetical protein